MKTTRLRNWTEELLREKPRTMRELVDQLNKHRHGTTVNQMGNILAKDPRFKIVGHTVIGRRAGDVSRSRRGYRVNVYGLRFTKEQQVSPEVSA